MVASRGMVQSPAILRKQTGAQNVGSILPLANAIARTVQSRAEDRVCVFEFFTEAQITDVVTNAQSLDLSAAIQNALNSSKSLYWPDGTYLANNLNASTDYQTHFFSGMAILKKNANGPLLTVSANRTQFYFARLDGDAANYNGHNIVKTGDHMTLAFCSSKDAEGRAVLDSDGDGLRIIGTNDVYETADITVNGYDIEIAGSGLYAKITDTYTSQATGGIYINGAGTVSIVGGQFGKLTWGGASVGGYVNNCRINGDIHIVAGNVAMDNSSCSADVTIGDGITPISQVTLGDTFTMQAGTTFTLEAAIQDCKAPNLETLRNNGVNVINNASNDNDVYDGRLQYTPVWAGGSPAIGNGTIVGYYQRLGRRCKVTISIQFGSTTNFGSGSAWSFSLPLVASGIFAKQIGPCLLEDSGSSNFYSAIAEVSAAGNTMAIRINGAGTVTPSAPFNWASGDRISLNIEYEI